MIRYTVLWRQDIQDDLATLWCDSPNRQQITSAADRIDAELSVDAHLKGEPQKEGGRTLNCLSLKAYFRIDEADRKVFVEAVHLVIG
jgi:hypothetical protein